MLNETPAQLVAHLSHPNGWWRDTAQQLLVLKQDKSVVPALQKLARRARRSARAHPRAVDARRSRRARRGARARADGGQGPQIRIQAIRASETLYKAGDKTLAADYKRLNTDSDTDVVMQSLMTMNTLKVADAARRSEQAQAANKAKACSSSPRRS